MTIPDAPDAWRSLLFVPGNRPDTVAEAGRSRLDVVALDLEGVGVVDGRRVDAVHVRMARDVLARAGEG